MENKLVSVIIPSYNRPKRTQRAVNSVAAQSYSPIELIVVDDGSSPPLKEDISLPENQLDSTKLITLDENQGANSARNSGIEEADGKFVSFLDSDDEWGKEKLHRQVQKLDPSEMGVSYTGVKNVDSEGNLNGVNYAIEDGNLSKSLLRGNVVGTFSSVIVDREAIRKVGKPDPNLPCFQDWEWYLRLSQQTKFTPVSQPLTIRHNEGGQISDDFNAKSEAYPILKRRLCEYADSNQEKKIAISGLQYQLGYSALRNIQYGFARQYFLKSITNNPKWVKPYIYLALSGTHYPPLRDIKRNIARRMEE